MKIIGIPGWVVGDTTFGVKFSYLEFIQKFGIARILTPMDSENPPEVDMIITPGGTDVSPVSYGAVPGFRTQRSNPWLEHFDNNILPEYIERETPVFAICRGAQQIWAKYGGHIDQHNGWHEQSKHDTDRCHELYFKAGYHQYSKLIDKVTSRHHQCMDSSEPYGVPDELNVIAYAKVGNDGAKQVVEVFEHKERQIFGVQFHPEDHNGSDTLCSKIINEYLNII